MKFIPREDYMLVEPLDRELSKIIHVIKNNADQGTIGAQGKIISVGPDCHSEVGMTVLYGGSGLGCIDYPGLQDCKIIQEKDVIGIVEGEDLIPTTDILVCETTREESKAGVIMVTKEKSDRAIAKKVGPKVTEVNAGDTILFDKYSGQTINLERKDYLVMREADVMAVLETNHAA